MSQLATAHGMSSSPHPVLAEGRAVKLIKHADACAARRACLPPWIDQLIVVVVVEGLGDGRLEHGGHGRPRREGEGHLEGVAGGRPERLQDHPPRRRRRHFLVRAYVNAVELSTHVGASSIRGRTSLSTSPPRYIGYPISSAWSRNMHG